MSIEQIIREYASGAYQLQKYRNSLNTSDPLEAEEAKIVSDMLSDMRYALDWMRRGRRPGNRRGAELTDVYRQRELFTRLHPMKIGMTEKQQLVMTLLELSERERTCFLLHMAHGLTYAEISARLKLSRATVQRYIERARDKVQQRIS